LPLRRCALFSSPSFFFFIFIFSPAAERELPPLSFPLSSRAFKRAAFDAASKYQGMCGLSSRCEGSVFRRCAKRFRGRKKCRICIVTNKKKILSIATAPFTREQKNTRQIYRESPLTRDIPSHRALYLHVVALFLSARRFVSREKI
jgi:hypothetical protein